MPAPASQVALFAAAGGDQHTGQPGSRGRRLRGERGQAGRLDERISHAERAEITDELSRHYGDGRLDDDEFSRRLDQALKAMTYGDLAGLLHDLPPADGVSAEASLPAVRRPPARRGRPVRPARPASSTRRRLLGLLARSPR